MKEKKIKTYKITLKKKFLFSTAVCLLSDNIYDYYNVSQGKVTIPSMDDGEEFSLTDVSLNQLLSNIINLIENGFSFIIITLFCIPFEVWNI